MKKLCKNLGHWFEQGLFSYDTAPERAAAHAGSGSSSALSVQGSLQECSAWQHSWAASGTQFISGSPSPHCASLPELVQVCPTLHHKHDVNIFQLLICDIYQPMFFSKALQKPLHKHNQNITCRRGKLFHWEVLFKKQTNKPQILMSTLPPCKSGVEMKNINTQLPQGDSMNLYSISCVCIKLYKNPVGNTFFHSISMLLCPQILYPQISLSLQSYRVSILSFKTHV